MKYALQTSILKGVLCTVKWLPLSWRASLVGTLTGTITVIAPSLHRRAKNNLRRAMPNMCSIGTIWRIGRNTGRTLTEILFNKEFASHAAQSQIKGDGLALLQEARNAKRGAIIISAHFGQWEAIRHVLMAKGLEAGALYRPNNNPYYEPLFLQGIQHGGEPIIPRGKSGFRTMLMHLRKGGFMAILADQHVGDGAPLQLMGQTVATTLSPAELAIRYDVPLVTAFAPRMRDGSIVVTLEGEIPRGTPEEMMQEYNARLEGWVRAHPEQWHWLHNRFKWTEPVASNPTP